MPKIISDEVFCPWCQQVWETTCSSAQGPDARGARADAGTSLRRGHTALAPWRLLEATRWVSAVSAVLLNNNHGLTAFGAPFSRIVYWRCLPCITPKQLAKIKGEPSDWLHTSDTPDAVETFTWASHTVQIPSEASAYSFVARRTPKKTTRGWVANNHILESHRSRYSEVHPGYFRPVL